MNLICNYDSWFVLICLFWTSSSRASNFSCAFICFPFYIKGPTGVCLQRISPSCSFFLRREAHPLMIHASTLLLLNLQISFSLWTCEIFNLLPTYLSGAQGTRSRRQYWLSHRFRMKRRVSSSLASTSLKGEEDLSVLLWPQHRSKARRSYPTCAGCLRSRGDLLWASSVCLNTLGQKSRSGANAHGEV